MYYRISHKIVLENIFYFMYITMKVNTQYD